VALDEGREKRKEKTKENKKERQRRKVGVPDTRWDEAKKERRSR
jgi:hypothetical protein